MGRPVTLFTGQWADLPLAELAAKARQWGYDGLELACWGDHFEVDRADEPYCQDRRNVLARHGLSCWAIGAHLVGQAVCDTPDQRHRAVLPPRVWADGEPEGVRRRAAEELIATGRAAARLGVGTVNGFTGSSIWSLIYPFPPTDASLIEAGYEQFAQRWGPILDAFADVGVRFALEVHPTEIAFDVPTAERALAAVGHHPAFGFNFDPSHLLWQGVDPARFLERFADRIFHVHIKDVAVRPNGQCSVLGSYLPFGDARRAWDFRSPGRGDVDFDAIVRALNRIGYDGPLSVEWEDPHMDRERGAQEACRFVREVDFEPANRSFEDAFRR